MKDLEGTEGIVWYVHQEYTTEPDGYLIGTREEAYNAAWFAHEVWWRDMPLPPGCVKLGEFGGHRIALRARCNTVYKVPRFAAWSDAFNQYAEFEAFKRYCDRPWIPYASLYEFTFEKDGVIVPVIALPFFNVESRTLSEQGRTELAEAQSLLPDIQPWNYCAVNGRLRVFDAGYYVGPLTVRTDNHLNLRAKWEAAQAKIGTKLYRGVSSEHRRYAEACQGIVRPRGGPSSWIDHNAGRNNSEYTSWTSREQTAINYALRDTGRGVVLSLQLPRDNEIVDLAKLGLDRFDENEFLIKGIVREARVRRVERTTMADSAA